MPPSAKALRQDEMSRLFLPPINRTMTVLDRSFFKKTVPLSAARVFDIRNITKVQKECSRDMLKVPAAKPIQNDPELGDGRKVLLLKPEVKHDDLSTVSPKTREYIDSKILELIPLNLNLTYDNWTYEDIITSILPEELLEEAPSGFCKTGHLAHLNLRVPYLPYKKLIAEIILDKNPMITGVVNKIEDVGTTSEFRTFPMEILAGSTDTKVTVSESNCLFTFDFAKVYWNTRLGNEHERLYKKFAPGEIVADVMAGVGPFAIPAAKNKTIVWANDLNPESYSALLENIKQNKVLPLVLAHNLDGRDFIRNSVRNLHKLSLDPKNYVKIPPPHLYRNRVLPPNVPPPQPTIIPLPPTFSHFIMNLPATAITFLDAYIGLYHNLSHLFTPHTDRKLPFIHVYCFQKPDFKTTAPEEIRKLISKHLEYDIALEDIELTDVRLVAPHKRMYCASFRLPADVAFREPKEVLGIEEKVGERERRDWLRWSRDDNE
ncbi:tRNA(m(1)G37)methyltransferase [Rhizina undulata]